MSKLQFVERTTNAAPVIHLSAAAFWVFAKESHVIAYLDEQTRVLLAQSRAPAAATLMTLLEQAKSEHVRKDVAVTLLGYGGIHATGDRGPLVSIGIGAGPGYIIDLTGPGGDETARFQHVGPAGGVAYPAAMIDVSPDEAEDE
jgi:hypothetical protein